MSANSVYIASAAVRDRTRDVGMFFSRMHPALTFGLFAIGYTAVVILGAYIGEHRRSLGITEPEVSMETAVASVLGLLAFILGFTFSLTWSRFAARNLLVVEQAKAIATCYLRAGLVTETEKLESRKILIEYTAILQTIVAGPEFNKSLARINELHMSLWQQAVSLVKEDVDSELRSLFIASVNDLLSITMERKVIAMFIRIPDAIWFTLFFLGLMSLFAFGYQAGMGGIDKFFQLLLLPVSISLVLVLIGELNSTHTQRHFIVTRQPLVEVMEMMKK
jgi:hypothetical protein